MYFLILKVRVSKDLDLNEFETVIETETGEKDESYLIDEMSGKKA